MCDVYRNEVRASEHYRRHVLVWALAAWRLYVVMMQRDRNAQQARQATHNKMAAFLNAATSGRLWTDRTRKTPPESESETRTEASSANDETAADEPTIKLTACQNRYLIAIQVI